MSRQAMMLLHPDKKKWLVIILVYFFFLGSGVAVVFNKYSYQKAFIILDEQYKKQTVLQWQWTQYMLEISSLTAYGRVDKIARTQLELLPPDYGKVHLVN